MIPEVELDLQVVIDDKSGVFIPDRKLLLDWITKALEQSGYNKSDAIVSLRIVDKKEITELNKNYRNIEKATNVLSFPYEALPEVELNLLGDIVVCATVVNAEASQQEKPVEQHWAHIIVHGVLHLLGYDHVEDKQAEQMEALEIDILSNLGIPDPYGELNTP